MTGFLQQIGLDRGSAVLGLLNANRLATRIAVMITGIIQYFFCIRLVFEYDETSNRIVTTNLKRNHLVLYGKMIKGEFYVTNCTYRRRLVGFLQS